MRQRARGRKAPRCARIRGEAGIPNDEHVVTDLRDPVKAKIKVRAPVFILELRERQKDRARTDCIFQPAGDLSGRESLGGKTRRGNVERRAENDVASATEHAAELRGPAVAVVELTRAQDRPDSQRAAGPPRDL